MTDEVRKLTRRQAECVRWVVEGKTDGEIGVILSISARTVRYHLDLAKQRLSVATRCQLVAQAIRTKEIEA